MPLRTLDNNFGTAKWIVSPLYSDGCTHTSLTAALASASSGDTISIRTGIYTENLTLKAGINLVAYTVDGITPTVTIIGKLSFSSAGTVSISGIRLQTNSDNFLAVTGSAASVVNLYDCYLNMTNATGIVNSSSSASSYVTISRCNGDIGTTGITLFTHSGAGITHFKYTNIDNSGSTVTRSTISAGGVFIGYCNINCPITTSSTGYIGMGYSSLTGLNVAALIHGGRSDSSIQHCNMQGFAAPTLTVNAQIAVYFCVMYSSSSPAINGSSTLFQSGIVFADNSTVTCSVSGKTMLTGNINLSNLSTITVGAGSPNTVLTLPKGSLYLRTDGSSSSTRAYSNTNSSTAWTSVTTAT